MSDYGRETVVFFEIDQPQCVKTYGQTTAQGTCAAVLGTLGGTVGSPPAAVTGDHKCYNTRATCQDPDNYSTTFVGSPTEGGVLTLRFCRPQVSVQFGQNILQYGFCRPLIDEIATTAGAINLAAMDRRSSSLGEREVVTVEFSDALDSDLLVDPYRLERNTPVGSPPIFEIFDPYTRGTFWGKWLARNPYHSNYRCRVREGFMGQALAEMRVRHYIIERIEGPIDGRVTLVAKDLFSRIEGTKQSHTKRAVAPTASRGELLAGISASATSATLSPAGIGNLDYPGNGSPEDLYVRIGDESIRCTRAGDALTLIERGALGTTADAHDAEDLVQWVLSYTAQRAHQIVHNLLVNYTGIEAGEIPLADWNTQAETLTELYSTHITEPTPVQDLIGELCEQGGFTLIPDVKTGAVRLVALRASAATPEIDDDFWIIDNSLSVRRQSDKRVSQVWVYYGQIDRTKELDDRRNYHSRLVTPDLDAESDQQYGTSAIREVFSRWIPQFGREFAQNTADRILAMFRDPPLEARLALHASKEDDVALARLFTLTTAEVQDDTGAPEPTACAAVEIERGENELRLRGQQVAFATLATDTGDRTITIENDAFNLNLRTIFDSLFTLPEIGSPSATVTFIVLPGVMVGSTSIASPALRSGTWPGGINIVLQNRGRIEGCAGDGGDGGWFNIAGTSAFPPSVGETGGDAVQADSQIAIDNTDGEIWSGGGGGGGGGVIYAGGSQYEGGGGGGAGGLLAGVGGGPGGSSSSGPPAVAGGSGTSEVGAPGGTGHQSGGGTSGGTGGTGGNPGSDGTAGGQATFAGLTGAELGFIQGSFPVDGDWFDPAAGGPTGRYIVGNALVTWIANGDRRGNVA